MTPEERSRIRERRDEQARRIRALDALVEAERVERFCLFCGERMPDDRVGGQRHAAGYVDTCALGIDADTGAIPDYEVFYECLVAGFDEVLALAA